MSIGNGHRAIPQLTDLLARSDSVAIVHDYLNQPGGAERVTLELAGMWPDAPLYTSLYRPDSTHLGFGERDVRTSFLQRLPVDAGFRTMLPLYPAAFRTLGVLEHELVISSSSGWAHGVRTAPSSTHIVYCHAPARWLYSTARYLPRAGARVLASPLLSALRRWDRRAARRADRYVANSQYVRRRIRSVYGLDADVVYPPVDVNRFTPRDRGERLLIVSRLLAYKRLDLAVVAASRAGIGLDVVGTGPDLSRLRALAGPTVAFHGQVDDAGVVALMEGCRALCLPGVEDFGIVTLEANAAGKPVIAFAEGGALETVADDVTGALFAEPTVEGLLAALRRCERLQTSPTTLAAHARRFAPEHFRARMAAAVLDAIHGQHQPVPVWSAPELLPLGSAQSSVFQTAGSQAELEPHRSVIAVERNGRTRTNPRRTASQLPADASAEARIAVCALDEAIAQRIEAAIARGGHELAGTSTSIEELIEIARVSKPTLIVLLHEFQPFTPATEVPTLRARLGETPLVIVASGFIGAASRKLVRAGADGLVLETEIEQALAATVDAVLAAQLCVPSSMREEIARPVFSHREKQVLELVARGMTNGEIAGELYLSESTVKSHLASSFRKLGVSSRAEAVRRALDPDFGLELAALTLPDRRPSAETT